jgi:hypothetical protein
MPDSPYVLAASYDNLDDRPTWPTRVMTSLRRATYKVHATAGTPAEALAAELREAEEKAAATMPIDTLIAYAGNADLEELERDASDADAKV